MLVEKNSRGTPADRENQLKAALGLQAEAAEEGLDWPEADTVWAMANEGLAEAKAASEDIRVLGARIAARAQREGSVSKEDAFDLTAADEELKRSLGSLLFAVVDICRVLSVDPEKALKTANDHFRRCLDYVRDRTASEGVIMGLEVPERLRALWKEADRAESRAKTIELWPSAVSSRDAFDQPATLRA